MTVAQMAEKVRKASKSDSQMMVSRATLATLMECDPKTVDKRLEHLPRLNDNGFIRFFVWDVAEYFVANTERSKT